MNQTAETLRRRAGQRGALIPALQEIQAAEGHIPRQQIPEIARAFGLTDAEVFGVISFYTDLHLEKQGAVVVRVCCGDSCAATDGYDILRAVSNHLRLSSDETSPDGRVTLRIAYCLGNCALSPSMMIQDRVCGRLTPEKAVRVVDRLREA